MAFSKFGAAGPATAPTAAPSVLTRPILPGHGWEPSILYLGALIVAEMVAVAFLSRHLRG